MRTPSLLLMALVAGAFPATLVAVPVVTNVTFVQQPDGVGSTRIRVNYDLASPAGNAAVSLRYSTNGGSSFSAATATAGAVGSGVTPGTGKTIDWAVAADLPGQTLANGLVVRVVAEDGAPVPLAITSTLGEGSVSQTASQTLTFTFAEPVTGFDSADVAVVGGTKGAFTTVSATVYTLAVVGSGGTVSVSVAGGAAASVATATTTLGASFSNFYQDTWSITLPGSVSLELIRIPAGTFQMGSPAGELSRNVLETQHDVTLTQDFYIGKTEVTQDQWAALQAFPRTQTFPGGNKPVHNVSWNDVSAWLPLLDAQVTQPGSFSLPTEAQWEYACRAGSTTRFSFGDGLGTDEDCSAEAARVDNMWYCGNNSVNGLKDVALKLPNNWGLYDMHGNAPEWCFDLMSFYPTGHVTDPTGGTPPEDYRIYRGGHWAYHASLERSANRSSDDPGFAPFNLSFRVCATR